MDPGIGIYHKSANNGQSTSRFGTHSLAPQVRAQAGSDPSKSIPRQSIDSLQLDGPNRAKKDRRSIDRSREKYDQHASVYRKAHLSRGGPVVLADVRPLRSIAGEAISSACSHGPHHARLQSNSFNIENPFISPRYLCAAVPEIKIFFYLKRWVHRFSRCAATSAGDHSNLL